MYMICCSVTDNQPCVIVLYDTANISVQVAFDFLRYQICSIFCRKYDMGKDLHQ